MCWFELSHRPRCNGVSTRPQNNSSSDLSHYPHITISVFAHLHSCLGGKQYVFFGRGREFGGRAQDRCPQSPLGLSTSANKACKQPAGQRGTSKRKAVLSQGWLLSKNKQHLAHRCLLVMTSRKKKKPAQISLDRGTRPFHITSSCE